MPSAQAVRWKHIAAALCLGVALSGCASAPPATFDLSSAAPGRAAAARGQIVVAEPVTVSLLDSERIAVRTSGGSVAYLSGAQWADRLPKLLQSRLIQSFENARRIGSVGRPGDRLVASTRLNAEIRTFEVREKGSEAVVEITVKLIDDRTGRIRAGQLFAARVPVNGIDGEQAASGLDQAARSVMGEIVAWTGRFG